MADTNNHAIRVVNIASGDVSTFGLRDADRLALRRRGVKKLAPLSCGIGSVTLSLNWELPADAHINPDVASQIEIVQGGETTVLAVDSLPIETRVDVAEGGTVLTVKTSIYWCRDEQSAVCRYSMETYELTLVAERGGPNPVSVVL